ncbi:MAG: ABC transporter ATP-binding protein [Spirochaetia bacterium]
MSRVRTVNLCKNFGENAVVKQLNMEIESGELVTILGPSGCGKTTSLRMIAGFIDQDRGEIYFDDEEMTRVPPHLRNVGYLFQRFALFPHMNVYENIEFGLKMNRIGKEEREQRIRDVLRLMKIDGYAKRKHSELSGGEQQRVALARVLVLKPRVLLLDEPLSSLDAKLRNELKYEIRNLQKNAQITAIYVTHDQSEAFAISDRIYVMQEGLIQQVGTPLELYSNPRSVFVADFLGKNNFLNAQIASIDSEAKRITANASDLVVAVAYLEKHRQGDSVVLSIRPEEVHVMQGGERRYANEFEGRVRRVIFDGATVILDVMVGDHLVRVEVHGEERLRYMDSEGNKVRIGFNECNILI